MIIATASRSGSPGATTLAALLAWAWPDHNLARFVIEADSDGGVLAPRWHHQHGLTSTPGLVELATHRGALDVSALTAVGQPLDAGLFAIPAGPRSAEVESALERLGGHRVAELASAQAWCFVDCGRVRRASPAVDFARRAVMTLVVFRPTLEESQAVIASVPELRDQGCDVGLVAIGDQPYHPAEVADACDVGFVHVLPDDRRNAALVWSGGVARTRRLGRSPLGRSARTLAASLHDRTEALARPATPTTAVEVPETAPCPRQPREFALRAGRDAAMLDTSGGVG